MTFLGHFPEKAIMPGALILEAMAQAAIILFASNGTAEAHGEGKKPFYYFGSVKARFLHPAVPGRPIKNQGRQCQIVARRARSYQGSVCGQRKKLWKPSWYSV